MIRIILVDDEERIRKGIEKLIGRSGYDVEVVGSFKNGREALDFALSQPEDAIDAVLTDIKMPIMDGLKLISRLRRERPQMIFVVVSVYNEFEFAKQAMRYGAIDYLVKPIDLDELDRILGRIAAMSGSFAGGAASSAAAEPAEASQETSDEANRLIEKVKTLLRENVKHDYSLKELADQVYINPNYLSKLFRKVTGETITDYVIHLRVERAKKLLEYHPELHVFEISEHVGYPDPSYFNRLFKKVTGLTPKEYRNRQELL